MGNKETMKSEPQTPDPSNARPYPAITFDHISYDLNHHSNSDSWSYMSSTPPPTLNAEDINPDNLTTLLIELLICLYRENLRYCPRQRR